MQMSIQEEKCKQDAHNSKSILKIKQKKKIIFKMDPIKNFLACIFKIVNQIKSMAKKKTL